MIAAIRTVFAMLFVAIAMPLGAFFGFPWTLARGNANLLYAVAMWIARSALAVAGVRVALEGLERLDPAATYIFMSNHVSNLDPPALIPKLPRRTSVLVKKELFRVPILGRAMLMGDLVPVDRSNREAAVNSMRHAEEIMAKGFCLTVFPEGTRSRDGRLLPFKKGPFYIAMDSGIPVVPVTVLGSEKLMPKGSSVIRSGVVRVVFHGPLLPKHFAEKEELIAAVRREIASALPAGLGEADLNSAP